MPRVGQARRRDANEAEIVQALQDIGIAVRRLSEPGLPDLLTYARGIWLPVEVKSPGGSLTASQQRFYEAAPFPIVESVKQALALFGVRS